MKVLETVVSVLIIVVSIGLFVAAESYPKLPWVSGGSPGVYPQFLVVIFAILGIALLIDARRTDPKIGVDIPKSSLRLLFCTAITMMASPWLLNWLGFKLGIVIFLVVSMILLTVERLGNAAHLVRIVVLSVLVTAMVYAVFEYGARVPLPVGRLFS